MSIILLSFFLLLSRYINLRYSNLWNRNCLFCLNIYLIVFFLKLLNLDNFFDDKFVYFIITLTTFFFLIGFFDDLKNLSPNKKLFWIILSIAFTLNIFPEIRLNHIKISFLQSYIHFEYSFIFLILCFALLSNALNMFDGINLQLILFTIFLFLF